MLDWRQQAQHLFALGQKRNGRSFGGGAESTSSGISGISGGGGGGNAGGCRHRRKNPQLVCRIWLAGRSLGS